jgi:predicted MFS family arabinose efflux permease
LGVYFASNAWTFLIAVVIFAVGRIGNNIPLALLGDLMPSDKIAWMTALNRFIADCGLALGPLVLGLITDSWGFPVAGGGALVVTLLTTCSLWLVFRKRPVIYQKRC